MLLSKWTESAPYEMLLPKLTELILRQFAQIIKFFNWIKISICFYFHPCSCQIIFQETYEKSRMDGQPGLHFSSPFYGGD
jgi:hypothetical protein